MSSPPKTLLRATLFVALAADSSVRGRLLSVSQLQDKVGLRLELWRFLEGYHLRTMSASGNSGYRVTLIVKDIQDTLLAGMPSRECEFGPRSTDTEGR